MLHFLRRHSQSRVIQVIFSLIIAVFVLWGVGAVVNEGSPLTTIASVDGKPIEQLSVQRAEMNLAQAYREAYKGQFTPEMRKAMNLRQRALDGLIDRAVLVNQAQKLGYVIDDQELRDSIVDSPAFQVGGRFNKEHYLRVLRSAGLTPGDFESAKREDLAVDRLQSVIGDNVTVSDDDARDDILLREEKRSLTFVKIPAAELSAQVQVTDADLEKFYEDNKARYAEPEKVKVELLSYPVDKFGENVAITEEQITADYEENLSTKYTQQHEVHARHILLRVPRDADDAAKTTARSKAEDIKKKIDAGGDFAALAKEFSEDPGSRDNGGDVGFFPRGRMVAEFDEAAFSLKPGEVSDVVETPFGFHVIKVEEVREERQKPLEEVRAEIVATLKKASASEKAKEAAGQDEQAIAGGATLDQIAEKRGLTVEKPEPLARNAAFPSLGRSLPLTNALWDAKPDGITAPVDVNGTLVIGKLVERIASTTPPFAEVKDRVDAAYRLQKATELAKTEAEKVLAAAKTDGLEKAATASSRKTEVAAPFARSGPFIPGMGSNQELKEATFALTQDKKLGEKVYVVGPDAYVVELREVTLPSDEDLKKKIAETRKNLLEKRRNDAFARYVAELKKKAHIEVNADRLEAIPTI
ncbi:SurA N-terminal domain-containing protein [Candidatus Binatia bacterium]|nr:SurA N-terminal domain-containing protein [Candidatus Binatia bacterium]